MEVAEHIPQVAIALVSIVAIVLGLGFVVKRLNHGGLRPNGEIKVVASTFLGPKERVLLLEVRKRQILVGVNPHCIQTLAEFPESADFSSTLHQVKAS